MSKELRKTITTAFRKFSVDPHHSPLKKQKDREIAGRFIDRLHTTTFETGDLPYYSKDGTAKHYNKAECVFAMMCDIVLAYWRMLQSTDTATVACSRADQITNKLILLDRVYKEYDQLKVLGDVKGYCLLSSYRKDLVVKQPEPEPETQATVESHVRDMAQDHVDSLKACLPDDGDMNLSEEQALRGGGAL